MTHNDNVTPDSGRGTRATIGGAAIGTTLAALALALLPGAPATAGGAGDPIHCDRAVCLKYVGSLLAIEDTDGDGFSDSDEKAAGSNPEDPDSRPAVLELLDLVAHGELPSFENRFSQVVILPEALPDGTKLDGGADLASLTEALGALAPSRKDGLSRLGISSDLMKEMGVGGSDVMSLLAGFNTSKEQPAFEARIGGMRASLISAGFPSGRLVTEDDHGDGTSTVTVSWFETNGTGSDNYTVTMQRSSDGYEITNGVKITTKGEKVVGKETCEGADCLKRMSEAVGTAISATETKSPTPPAAPSQPSSQPSGQPSAQPSPTPSSPPASAEPSPSASDDDDELTPLPKITPSGGYEDPNADETRVVITPADVRRVVRIVRGSNTTPAQVDVERPEIDPSEIEDPTDTYAYRDPTYETGTFTTVSPVKTGDAVTNYGPEGPRP